MQIFIDRLKVAYRNNFKYAKQIANDHAILFLLIAVGVGMMVYRQWLTAMPTSFWHSNWVNVGLFVYFVLVLSVGRLTTYFKPADTVFMLGFDKQLWQTYLPASLVFSVVKNIAYLIIVMSIIMPIIWLRYAGNMVNVVILLVSLVLVKINLLVGELVSLKQGRSIKINRWVTALAVGQFSLLLWFDQILIASLIEVVWIGMPIVLHVHQRLNLQTTGMNFQTAIAQSQQQDSQQRSYLGYFVDLPGQANQVVRRAYMDWLIRMFKNGYERLYWQHYLRTGDELALTIRLVILNGFLQIGLNNILLMAFFSILLTYLLIIQLVNVFKNVNQTLWSEIAPVTFQEKQRFFLQFMRLPILLMLLSDLLSTHIGTESISLIIALLAIKLVMVNLLLPKIMQKK